MRHHSDDPRRRRRSALRPEQLDALRAALAKSLAAIDGGRAAPAAAPAPRRGGDRADPLGALLDALDGTGVHRVLSRLEAEAVDAACAPTRGASSAVIVDVETTGLDHRRDEVIEIGMLRFEHLDGAVLRVTGELCRLREPARAIGPGITRLTGITDEMVAGRAIDLDEIDDFLLGVDLVIAHNARFDRAFCEALHPGFARLPWACSVDEVDWTAAGFEGARLGHLLMQSGAFHDGHRALDDCRALLHLLRCRRPGTDGGGAVPLLADLVASASETRRRIWAEGAPFERKDLLKARGYRWSPGGASAPKAWWRDVPEEDFPGEADFLRREIYGSRRPLRTERMTARDRYRPL